LVHFRIARSIFEIAANYGFVLYNGYGMGILMGIPGVPVEQDMGEKADGEKNLAERVGFEPTMAKKAITVFETVPFNHSGTSPG
jgi:hypothetical protein